MHKSICITVLGLVLLRLLWRAAHPPPPLLAAYARWERVGAHVAHGVLYALMPLLPFSGWLHDSAWKDAATYPMTLYGLVPWPRIGLIERIDPATKESLHPLFGSIHTAFGYVLYGASGAAHRRRAQASMARRRARTAKDVALKPAEVARRPAPPCRSGGQTRVDQHAPLVGGGTRRGRHGKRLFALGETEACHLPIEGGPVAPIGVDDPHLRRRLRVAADEAGQRRAIVALVEQIAADDEVEAPAHDAAAEAAPAPLRLDGRPVAVPVRQRREVVEAQVLAQEARRERMAVARGDVGPAPMPDDAGQGEAAAHFEDPLAGAHRPRGQARREMRARRPEQAEQGPRRRRDAAPLGLAERI